MLNYKQILYFTFLFLILNASHTLCHIKIEPRPVECCPCEHSKANARQELEPKKSHAGKQMQVNVTQELKPKKGDAAGKQMQVNATQELKPEKSDASKQMQVNTTQESKPEKSDAGKQMQRNTEKSDAGKQMQGSTTQESKPEKSHAGKQMQVNATQESKPKNSHAGKQMNVNAQVQHSDQQFMKWIGFVGKLKHTTFKAAMNKVIPSITLTVDKNAALGDFTCIQDAIDSLPLINLVRVVIKVHAGVYTEKVSIPATKSFITIEGAGADKTIIQWGDTAQTTGPFGKLLGTFGSATFAVNSPYFIAKNITVKNTAPVPQPGAVGQQAVAFRISADTASFVGCKFLGAQDTLYDHIGRHYYKDCYIEGSVDFIFGSGLSMFENCAVHAIAGAIGAVTAQARKSILDDSGFSFVNCKVTGSGALYLGRAWGAFSRVVFAYTYMDNIIIPKGWYNWGDPSREMTVFYGQYKCNGAGANYAGRVPWSRELTDEEAKPFISLSFIDGSEWVKF